MRRYMEYDDSMETSETRSCQNCKSRFIIEPEDFSFYKKIGVPPPTWCPPCRNMRRMAWREERSLYRSTCKLCGKSIVTIHAPDGPFTVYCRECFRSDKWDSMSYGRDYDFSKPFFRQYRELMEVVPRPALTGVTIVNSPFSHACKSVKNCYLTFWSYFSENSQYCHLLLMSRSTYDGYVVDNSDHAYESLHSNRLYKVRFGYFADECLDSAFLFDCLGCSDCFGCVNLRKKNHCLFNRQLSKEDYTKQLAYWDLGSYVRLKEAKDKFHALYLSMPHRYAHVLNSQNVTGDVIRDTKNCATCFSALDGVENCKYVYIGGLNLKDSYDVSGGGDTSELTYEIFGVTGAQRVFFSVGGHGCQNMMYSDWNENSSHLFGCISLMHKQYCILNKRYTKDEYEKMKAKIIAHMNAMPYVDKKGRIYKFGEFFPPELSAYPYNESFAFSWYPKTKEEVLAEGWKWQEPHGRSYQITVPTENISDHIRDVPDSIVNETIGCLHGGICSEQCTTAFRPTREELEFYRVMNVALPRLCPNCRYAERMRWRNKFDLFKRKCMCSDPSRSPDSRSGQTTYQNTAAHFHGEKPCPNEFETTFAPEKPEIVYCDQCYKAEFL